MSIILARAAGWRNRVPRIREKLTYANVMATIAVFIALGGGAYAVSLDRNSVGSKQLKPGAVKPKDTAASLRLKCPGGTRYHEGACIETAQRGSGTFVTALDGCNAAGRRLPSAAELMGFAREPGVTVGPVPTFEWALGLDSDEPELKVPGVAELGANVIIANNPFDDIQAYRCVANARR
jgi:hypothetical protein